MSKGHIAAVRRFVVMTAALMATACGAEAEKTAAPKAPAPVQIGSENVVAVTSGVVVVGPIISGELRPEREATVRAELGGSMTDVMVKEAQPVSKGALLGRIETRTLEDARQSAASAVRSSENQLEVARREAERTGKLVEAGALAARDLDVSCEATSPPWKLSWLMRETGWPAPAVSWTTR
jgi:multidrug efflux pump subunit AcrA (membrane-fusion protein)